MPGPGKKPSHLKVLAGTDRKDRAADAFVDFAVIDVLPEAPLWLPNAHAVIEFNRLAQVLLANKLLTDGAITMLAHLAALHGNIVAMHAAAVPPTASMLATYRQLCNDFGLSPVAQGKVSPTAEGTKKNKFANNANKK